MYHVFPINDVKEHDTAGTMCECEPFIDWEDGLVIHHSYDGREVLEEAEVILNGAPQ